MSKIPDFTPIPPERHESNSAAKPPQNLTPRKFIQLLAESSHPIYLLDSRNRIRFANQALSNATGVPHKELLGLECVLRVPNDSHPNPKTASLLAIPTTGKSNSDIALTCIPLPQVNYTPTKTDNNRSLSPQSWKTTIVLPLHSQTLTKHKESRRSTVRLCIWTEENIFSSLGSIRSRDQDQAFESNELQAIHSILHQNRSQWSRLDNLASLLGNSGISRKLMQQVQAAIALDTNCLISGSAGSETTTIAQAIFEHRRQREGRSMASIYTLPIDCQLMDRLLITEMLEMASSYSDQSAPRIRDSHKSANRFTALENVRVNLILVGIDKLAIDALEPLLRFLNQHPQVAVIATASTRDWRHAPNDTESSTLRESSLWNELGAAIEVMIIDIPDLQTRAEDLGAISEQILEQFRLEHSSKKPKSIGPNLRRWIQSYAWPGNYSELKNVLKYAYEHAVDTVLQPHDLPLSVRTFASHDLQPPPLSEIELDKVLEEFEKSILKRALDLHQNNRAAAARSLGISRPRLLRRLEQLGIDSGSPEIHPKGSKSTSKGDENPMLAEPNIPSEAHDPESPIFESIDE